MDVSELMRFKPDVPEVAAGPSGGRGEAVDHNQPHHSQHQQQQQQQQHRKRKSRFERTADDLRAAAKQLSRHDEQDEVEARKTLDRLLAEQQRNRSMTVSMETPNAAVADNTDNTTATEEAAVSVTNLKQTLLRFEKCHLRNQEMRVKYPERPEKFFESERELHEAIQELQLFATVPQHYGLLVSLRVVPSLAALLNHDNIDVAAAVVDLLKELTDSDNIVSNRQDDGDDDGGDVDDGEVDVEVEAKRFVSALIDEQLVALLVQNMERLNEAVVDENRCIHASLGVVENVLELVPEQTTAVATRQQLCAWLLRRLKQKPKLAKGVSDASDVDIFDSNRLYASEVLYVCLQNSDEARELVGGSMEGIDVLLQQLAIYKRHNPTSAEEIECMENIFNCLCSCLLWPPNRERFLKGEGLQLMILLLRVKKLSRLSAVKVLDYAMCGVEGIANCQKFVDINGLGAIFPLFMKPPKVRTKETGVSDAEMEEHVVNIVASLLKNCSGAQATRLLQKFVEKDHEKVDRLIELHFKYVDKVNVIDESIARVRKSMTKEEVDEDELYLRRLDSGLFTLQQVDVSIAVTSNHPETASVKKRVVDLLNLRGSSKQQIQKVLGEYASSFTAEENSRERDLVEKLLVDW